MNKALRSAFPIPSSDLTGPGSPGMTLRDWYAGMAMQGLLAADRKNEWPAQNIMEYAHDIAELMMQASDGYLQSGDGDE